MKLTLIAICATILAASADLVSKMPPEPVEFDLAPAGFGMRSANSAPSVQRPFPIIKDWSSLVITIRRTACFGACPVYSLEILGDGSVTYFGEAEVSALGQRTTRISQQALLGLVQKFRDADFFWLRDVYSYPATCGPTIITSISFDGHSKQVVDYYGSDAGMPAAVSELEDAIGVLSGAGRWIGRFPIPSLPVAGI